MLDEVLSAAVGILAGAGVVAVVMWRQLKVARQDGARLQEQLDVAATAQVTLAELRVHLSSLRHDIRGILSPALLVADRLLAHEEPAVRRAGEVITRTVERASTRLAETRLDQVAPVSAEF